MSGNLGIKFHFKLKCKSNLIYKKNWNVSGKSKSNYLRKLHQPGGSKQWLLLHYWRKHRMWQIHLPGTPKTENPWGKMDRRACRWLAKSRWQKHQHAWEILQITQKMGIYFPNLCHFHKNKKATIGYGKIPRQAEDLLKKHSCWQIRFFRTDERQRIHGWKWTRSFQIPLQQFWIDDIWRENQNHLSQMHTWKMLLKD